MALILDKYPSVKRHRDAAVWQAKEALITPQDRRDSTFDKLCLFPAVPRCCKIFYAFSKEILIVYTLRAFGAPFTKQRGAPPETDTRACSSCSEHFLEHK
ncbi:hypothetical protein ISCGN_004932 [Ixodes scapularis]